jgi:hypothetical protein
MFDYMPEANDFPIAVLERLSEDRDTDGFWMRIDPVNLEEDKNFLMMSYPAVLDDLTLEESTSFVESINRHFAEDGWEIQIAGPTRWYLRLPEKSEIMTTPPWHVVGRDILHHLPTGEQSNRWRAWLTEIQMLLHTHPVNEQRIARGQKAVNGVWVWGGGFMPEVSPGKDLTLVGQNAFLSGVALLSRSNYLCQNTIAGTSGNEQVLLIDYARQALLSGSIENALQTLEMLDREVFEPIQKGMKSGKFNHLAIIDCPGNIVDFSSRGLKKWWRRRKVVTAHHA